MKTFEEFRREVLADIKRSEEMSLKPKEYSYAQIETMAAKEYAKSWVKEALKNEPDSFIEYYLKEIDKQ